MSEPSTDPLRQVIEDLRYSHMSQTTDALLAVLDLCDVDPKVVLGHVRVKDVRARIAEALGRRGSDYAEGKDDAYRMARATIAKALGVSDG